MDESKQQVARKFFEEFGFKEKINRVLADKDENISYIVSANLAIFGIAISIIFASKGDPITPIFIPVLLSAFSTAISFFLCLWYLLRIKERTIYFQKQQERIYKETEDRAIEVLDFMERIIKNNLSTQYHLTNGDKSKIDNESLLDVLAKDGQFIFTMIMKLALKETLINSHKSFISPLDEKYSRLKLVADYLSEHIRNWGLAIGFVLILCAILIKFIFGQ